MKKIQIAWTKKAEKSFNRLDLKNQRRVRNAIKGFLKYILGESSKRPDVKKLKGKLASFYRLRGGSWRIIFSIDAQKDTLILTIIEIERRKDVY
ncbi:MAG TPA: type II toxin-antitoxin system RelE/ParE family toxin [Thermotogaceae bacterium]|nr:type II toxin-antitoxin system RelE/ParE family toxin [Thermotogaceae bacterium]